MNYFQKKSYPLLLGWLLCLFLPGLPAFAQMDIPVDLQSGRPIITIPLYELRDGDLSVPVALTYNAGGVQVGTADSRYQIGANWDIIAGGSITRSVRGLPDDCYPSASDTRTGWLNGTLAQTIQNFTIANDNNAATCSDESQNYPLLNSFGYDKDTEPDVFTIQFGSLSGQFVFDQEKKIRCIPFQNLDIQYYRPDENSRIQSFTITTPDGIVYTFDRLQTGVMQTTSSLNYGNVYFLQRHYNQYLKPLTFTSEWGLSSIKSPRGGQIYFTYTSTAGSVTPTQVYLRKSSGTDYESGNTKFVRKVLYQTTQPGSLVTQKIYAGYHHRVDIIADDAENDQSSKGSKVKIFATGEIGGDQLIKQYKFEYFKALQNPRKYLRSIQPINGCLEDPRYSFEYSSVYFDQHQALLPGPESFEQDYWGFYNANQAKTLNPTLYVYPSLLPAQERYRLEPIPNFGLTSYILPGGFDRRPNASAVVAGTLNKINYPTGGNARLFYESNEYYDATAQAKFKGGGIRVSKIVTHDGLSYDNDIVKEYQYDVNGGKLFNRPQFIIPTYMYRDLDNGTIYAPNTVPASTTELEQFEYFTIRSANDLNTYSFDSPNVMYPTATEKQTGKGKTVYEFLTPALYGQMTTSDYAAPNHFEATFSYLARPSSDGNCPPMGKIEPGYYTFPYPTNTNYSFERGVLKGIKVYNEGGALLQEKAYTYQRLHLGTSPVQVWGLAFDVGNSYFAFGKYKLLTEVSKVTSVEKETTYDPTNLTRKTDVVGNFFYDSPNHRMLSSTSTATSNDGTNATTYRTKYKYPLDYTASLTNADAATVAIQRLQNAKMNGVVIEQVSTLTKPGEGEKVTGASLTKFATFPGDKVFPAQSLVLQTNVPLSDFAASTVLNASSFQQDSRYRVVRNYLEYNEKGYSRIETNYQGNPQSTHFHTDGNRPLLVAKNATYTQLRYSGFDGGTNIGFDTPGPFSLTAGKIGRGIRLPGAYTFLISNLERGIGSTYTFSCWAKTQAAGNLTFKVKDQTGTVFTTKSLSYTNTTGAWTYYEIQLPVDLTKPTIFLEVVTSVAAVLDDMLFYPALAEVSLMGYEYQHVNAAGTILKSNVSSQMLYSSFESSNYFTSFTPASSYPIVGSNYGQAIQLPAGGGQLSRSGLERGDGPTYTFFFRVKGINSGTITVTVSDQANVTTGSKSLTFNTSGFWEQYEVQLPVSQTSPTINVQVTSSAAALLDDLLFYPTLAKVSNASYSYQRTKTAQSLGGITKFQEYDALGRPTLVSDQDNNLLQRTLYHYKDQNPVVAFFAVASHPNGQPVLVNETVSLTSGSACEINGVQRNWNFGDGTPILTNGGTNPNHVYPRAGVYTITLTASHPQYGSATYQQTITVKEIFAARLCVNGVTYYDICTKQGYPNNFACADNASANLPVGTNTFEAIITNPCSATGQTYQYKWERRFTNDQTRPYWEVLTNTTSKISLTMTYPSPVNDPLLPSDSYEIRCTITPSCLANPVTTNPNEGGTVTFFKSSTNCP